MRPQYARLIGLKRLVCGFGFDPLSLGAESDVFTSSTPGRQFESALITPQASSGNLIMALITVTKDLAASSRLAYTSVTFGDQFRAFGIGMSMLDGIVITDDGLNLVGSTIAFLADVSAPGTVQIDVSSGTAGLRAVVIKLIELKSVRQASPVIATGSKISMLTTGDTVGLTTTEANAFLVAVCGCQGTATGPPAAVDGTELFSDSTGPLQFSDTKGVGSYREITTPGPVTAEFSWGVSNRNAMSCVEVRAATSGDLLTIYSVSTPAELTAALAIAVGGDRIEMAAGSYGVVTIGNSYTSDVRITSADPLNQAIFNELHVTAGASHLDFDRLTFFYINDPGDPESYEPFTVTSATFIMFRNSIFKANLVGGFGFGKAMKAIGNTNFTLTRNETFNYERAASIGNSTNVTVSANNMHSLRSEGLNLFDLHTVLIEGNWIHDHKTNDALPEHPDMIQFWNTVEGQFSENVTIRGNFLDSGDGDWTQCIFVTNTAPTMSPAEYHRNFLIEDNVCYNAHLHGITVYQNIDGLTIRNNTLLYDLDADEGLPGNDPPWVTLGGTATMLNTLVDKNVCHLAVKEWQPVTPETNTINPNYIVSRATYPVEFVNALAASPTIEDLVALPGTTIMTDGLGARMTRGLDLPLVVGPLP